VTSSEIQGLEPEPAHVLERVDGLVAQVPPKLSDGRLRVREAPEDEPDDHASS